MRERVLVEPHGFKVQGQQTRGKRRGIPLQGVCLWHCPRPRPAGILEHWDPVLWLSEPTAEGFSHLGENQGFLESQSPDALPEPELVPSSIAWASSQSSEPTSSSSTPSGASKAPPKGSMELERVATNANNFWMELMGEKGILSSCHGPSPRGTSCVTTLGKGAGGSQLWLLESSATSGATSINYNVPVPSRDGVTGAMQCSKSPCAIGQEVK